MNGNKAARELSRFSWLSWKHNWNWFLSCIAWFIWKSFGE